MMWHRRIRSHTSEDAALHWLKDLCYEVLLERPLASKSGEISMLLADRVEVGTKLLRGVLRQSTRFAHHERRWGLAVREQRGRPVAKSVEMTLAARGRPFEMSRLIAEMALLHDRLLEYFEGYLPQFMASRAEFFALDDDLWGLRRWLPQLDGDDAEAVFLQNFFDDAELARKALDRLEGHGLRVDDPVERAVRLLERVETPVHNRVLGYHLWTHLDGALALDEFFAAMLTDPPTLLLSGGYWALAEWTESWRRRLRRLDTHAEQEPEPEGETLTLALSPADMDEIVAYILDQDRPATTEELTELIFELPDSSPQFEEATEVLREALTQEQRLVAIGRTTWCIPSQIPNIPVEVPRGLDIEFELSGPPEEHPDAPLADKGLAANLTAFVHDPFFEEIGEEDEIDETRLKPKDLSEKKLLYAVPPWHLDHGTMKLRKIDWDFFPAEFPMFRVRALSNGKDVELWGKPELGLVFGLADWYRAQKAQPGCIIQFKPTEDWDTYELTMTGKTESLLVGKPERIKELKALREEAAPWTVFELIVRLLRGHRKGLKPVALWTEVNLVRRVPKRIVASVLSSFACFFTRPSNSDNWVVDPKRVDEDRKKAKKKWILKK